MCRPAPLVSSVRFTPARPPHQATGLLGWVSCTLGVVRVDGIALRRTRTGRLTLSFPARRGRGGEQHAYVRPLDDRARLAIEHEVFAAIDIDGGGAG